MGYSLLRASQLVRALTPYARYTTLGADLLPELRALCGGEQAAQHVHIVQRRPLSDA